MTELKLEIDETKLDDAIGRAILSQLDGEARERVLAMGIAYLSKPRTYGGPSPLTEAFQQALERKVRGIVEQILEEDPVLRTKVEEGVRSAVTKLLGESERIRQAAARALVDGALKVQEEDEDS